MNWKERIAAAKLRDAFTVEDRLEAGMWQSCVVGERFGARWQSEVTKGKINKLGNDFDSAVMADDVKEAERLYLEIQKQ